MKKGLSTAAKTAIGGMSVALSVIILLPTALEIFVYALPAMAGMLTMLCVIELGKSWAFGVYFAASAIGLLLVPNKEAVVMYAAFFGYYPIIKAILESRLPRAPEYIIKFAVFNVSVLLAYVLLIKVFGMPFDEVMGIDDNVTWSEFAVPIMLALGNVVFVVFDLALTRVATVYVRIWQKKFRRMFRFK